jgi:tetratricopeptide (TPR) repeat protein
MSTKKPASLSSDRRFTQAVEAFEKAVRAVGKKEFDRAKDLLDDLIASYSEERDVVDRARAYRALCERALERRPAFRPKSFEELLNYGVFLHNRGDFEDALKTLHQAAEIHPKNEHVQYCIAASSARAGDTATCLKALRSAIQSNAANRAQALHDADFDPVREDEEFDALVHDEA